MDDVDLCWLNRVNTQRYAVGVSRISELVFEQTMEELERQSWTNMQALLKTEEFLGLEYDENVICDVCRAVCRQYSCEKSMFQKLREYFFKNDYSRTQRKVMRWSFVIGVTSAYTKPATVSSASHRAHGCVNLALWDCDRLVSSAPTRVVH